MAGHGGRLLDESLRWRVRCRCRTSPKRILYSGLPIEDATRRLIDAGEFRNVPVPFRMHDHAVCTGHARHSSAATWVIEMLVMGGQLTVVTMTTPPEG